MIPVRAKREITDFFLLKYPQKAAHILESLTAPDVFELTMGLPSDGLNKIFSYMPVEKGSSYLHRLKAKKFAEACQKMDPTLVANYVSRWDREFLSKRLELLPKNIREEVQDILNYPPGSAGSLMDPAFITVLPTDTVEIALNLLRKKSDTRIFEISVVDERGVFLGMTSVQTMALADPQVSISHLINTQAPAVSPFAPSEEVIEIFDRTKVTTMPVVNIHGVLVGVIRYATLISASKDEAVSDLITMVGASPDEKALSPALFAVKARLPWLMINLATAFLASAVVGFFEGTIAKITALAVLLPIVAGQSGNTGSQAMAVLIRGLAVKEIRPRQWHRVIPKELLAGFLNGLSVAIVTSVCVYIWGRDPALAGVLGLAMIGSMMTASVSGALVPLALSAFGKDPAQSSSIILTTVTDVVGFSSFLGLATFFVNHLMARPP